MIILEAHLLSHDDEQFLPWAVRYWSSLTAFGIEVRLVIHDGGPGGKSGEIAKAICPWAEVRRWDTSNELNDHLAMTLKNECWRGSTADFVCPMDADELLYFPHGTMHTLETYRDMGAAVLKPHGFEMFSDEWIEPSPDKHHRITSIVKDGAPDDKWYSKGGALFSPRLVHDSGIGIGAHESRPTLKDGRGLNVDQRWPFADPPVYLLHYHHIGGLERIAARYDATRKRLSAQNVRCNWGNVHDSGIVHAQKKRDAIIPNLRRVIP